MRLNAGATIIWLKWKPPANCRAGRRKPQLYTEEIDELMAQIAAGTAPADALKRYYEEERRNVFGHDYRTDANGKPVEQGIGAKGHESLNHFSAMLKAEQSGGIAPGTYKAAVTEIWKRDPKRAEKLGLARL